MNDKPAIYQAKDGSIELRIDQKHDTIWATMCSRERITARPKCPTNGLTLGWSNATYYKISLKTKR